MANQHTKAKETAEEVHNILGRVSSLETGLDSLSNDVRSLARSLEGFASETRTAIQNLSQKMADGQKTPWGVLFAGMSVLLTIISLVGGLVAYGVNEKINANHEAHFRHESLEAHPTALKQMGAHSERLKALEQRVVGNTGNGWHKPDHIRYAQEQRDVISELKDRVRELEKQVAAERGSQK